MFSGLSGQIYITVYSFFFTDLDCPTMKQIFNSWKNYKNGLSLALNPALPALFSLFFLFFFANITKLLTHRLQNEPVGIGDQKLFKTSSKQNMEDPMQKDLLMCPSHSRP